MAGKKKHTVSRSDIAQVVAIKTFTAEQIAKKLKEIRDLSLLWWGQCVETRTTAGSATAYDCYAHACDEIERLEQKDNSAKIQGKIELIFSKPEETESDE